MYILHFFFDKKEENKSFSIEFDYDDHEELQITKKTSSNDTINDILYENLLSRYISGLFIEQHSEELDGTHHILVNISINDENYSITIGSFDLDNDVKYLNGIVMT